MTASEFRPDWVCPPGATILAAMRRRDLSASHFRAKCGLSSDAYEGLIEGTVAISPELAERLTSALGASCDFWLRRDRLYRARRDAGPVADNFERFADSVPFGEMRRLGWLDEFEGLSRPEAIRAFFADSIGGAGAPGAQLIEAVRFRISIAHDAEPAAVAAWLREGVRQGRRINCAPLDRARLRQAVPDLRALTRIKDPVDYFPRLVEICSAVGVAVVFVRTPRGCPASGATHYDGDRAIVQLSFRYRSDDHLWFTLFHEIGHILLHGYAPIFIEGQGLDDTDEEAEANAFSARILIPEQHESEIHSVKREYRAIMRLAKRLGVSPGVLVGQMQRRGLLRHNQMNFLKVRYDWEELADA